jgi:hypothetical protein
LLVGHVSSDSSLIPGRAEHGSPNNWQYKSADNSGTIHEWAAAWAPARTFSSRRFVT